MLMLKEKVIDRTLRGWAISVVHVAGAEKNGDRLRRRPI